MATDERADPDASPESRKPPLERAYFWEHVVFFQSHSCSIGKPEDRIRRLSAALIVANRQPFEVLFEGQLQQFQAVLASPRVLRGLLQGTDSDLTIIEINVAHSAFSRLRPRFSAGILVPPTAEETRALQEMLKPDFLEPLSCSAVRQRFNDILAVLGADPQDPAHPRDPRIDKILQLVEATPFDETSSRMLAAAVFMSESRLRHFFKEQMDCSLAQYVRWANVWKAMRQWHGGLSLSEAATAVGFYDRAHLNRAIREQYFEHMSTFLKARNLSVHPCL